MSRKRSTKIMKAVSLSLKLIYLGAMLMAFAWVFTQDDCIERGHCPYIDLAN